MERRLRGEDYLVVLDRLDKAGAERAPVTSSLHTILNGLFDGAYNLGNR
jgi:hypothetical protein